MAKTLAEKMTDSNNEIPIRCKYCGYTWPYTGDMRMATCPSCSNKNDVEENRTDSING